MAGAVALTSTSLTISSNKGLSFKNPIEMPQVKKNKRSKPVLKMSYEDMVEDNIVESVRIHILTLEKRYNVKIYQNIDKIVHLKK